MSLKSSQKVTASRYQKALIAILEADSIKEASEQSGISRASLFRFLQDPAFRKELSEARGRMVDIAVAKLSKACSAAVGVLVEIMKNRELSPSPRVTAAKGILDLAFKAGEIEDLKQRLEILEERLNR